MYKIHLPFARHGFYQVWFNPHTTNANVFFNIFRQRLLDKYGQKWNKNVVRNNILTIDSEPYLGMFVSRNVRSCILFKAPIPAWWK